MNLTLAIAVYANICKALGLPLSFPGKPGAYTALYQCTDAALLAKAVGWMATDPKCANQAFNITNSDLIRWQNLWPKFAKFFGMELAPPRHINLARSLPATKATRRSAFAEFVVTNTATSDKTRSIKRMSFSITSNRSAPRSHCQHGFWVITRQNGSWQFPTLTRLQKRTPMTFARS
jgi:hypothetical protein